MARISRSFAIVTPPSIALRSWSATRSSRALDTGPSAVRRDQAKDPVVEPERAQRPKLEANEAEVDRARQRRVGSQIAGHDLTE